MFETDRSLRLVLWAEILLMGASIAQGQSATRARDHGNALFQAKVQATEEAIVNALVAAGSMTGINGNQTFELPHERLREILRKYNSLEE